MIAVDTNILVRVLVRDDPQQADAAERLLDRAFESGEACFVSDPVLCELEWVLDSCYRAPRADVLAVLRELMGQEHFAFEDREVLRRAVDAYQTGRADFSDYLIGAKGRARGARATYTFEKALRGEEGFAAPV